MKQSVGFTQFATRSPTTEETIILVMKASEPYMTG